MFNQYIEGMFVEESRHRLISRFQVQWYTIGQQAGSTLIQPEVAIITPSTLMKQQADTQHLSHPSAWVDRYADYLFSYAFYRVPDTSIAEDLVQETFMAALSSQHAFNGKASEKTWLTGILKHKIMDYLRKKYRTAAQSLDTVAPNREKIGFDGKGHWLNIPRHWEENPQEHYEQREFMEVLQQCLAGLSSKQADAFRLRELDDADAEEICKVLQISATNYWVTMHRARLHIRGCMEVTWFAPLPATG